MYQRQFFVAIAFTVLTFFVSPLAAQTPSVPTPPFFDKAQFDKVQASPLLAADTRLDRKTTLNETEISLGTLLTKQSSSGLPLACAADCMDRKLQVRLNNRPLRSLMTALAQLTPGTWKREGKGYCLYSDPKATEYEDNWWKLYGFERTRALDAMRVEITARMQQKPYRPTADDPNPENVPEESFDREAQSQEFWNLLPQPLQEQVAAQIVDTSFYRAGQLYADRTTEGAVVAPFSSLPAQAQTDILASYRWLNKIIPGSKAVKINPVAVSFNNVGFDVTPRIQSTNGAWYDVSISLGVNTADVAPALSVDHTGLPERVKAMGDKAPKTWIPLAAYQEQHVWANDPPRSKPDLNHRPRRPEVLSWLAYKAGLEFVADYYSVAGEPLPAAMAKNPPSRPLKQELDYRAAQEDMSWKQRTDGLYLFRDNRWYRDDRLEVPDEIAQGLLKTLRDAEQPLVAPSQDTAPDNSPAVQLSVADSIVAQLTPWQIANGLPNYTIESNREAVKASATPAKLNTATMTRNGKTTTFFMPAPASTTARPFDKIADIVLDDYHTYLFHSSLTQEQAEALLGDGLPVSALDTVQAEQAAYLLPELQTSSQNQPPLLHLRPEAGFNQVQLGADGLSTAGLTLQRVRLTSVSSADAPTGDSAAP